MSRVAVVLLAAGLSRRFGSPKQLFEVEGKPMVRHMAEMALKSRAGRVIVVTGAARGEVEAALAGLPVELAFNADFASGQSSTVRCGLAAALEDIRHPDAILFLPVDMPFLRAATLDRLIEAWQQERPAAVVPTYAGKRGAPVLWDRRAFAGLAALAGDQGGRALLPRYAGEIREIAIDDAQEGRDFDYRCDFAGPEGT